MKIIFFGSDDFAAVSLKHLIDAGCEVAAVVTQPDTRQGRGMQLVASPIKVMACDLGLRCLQPPTLKEPAIVGELQELQADIFVVVAYGKLLTQEILDMPKIFAVNVHGSLLPKYRGAAPINWAILNGDHETGITIQKMALALDAGDIISQVTVPISEEISAKDLRKSMAEHGAVLLVKTLTDIGTGQFKLTPQDASKSSYASKLSKDMGRIDWNRSARHIYNQMRGLSPWPGTYTDYQSKVLKILKAQIRNNASSAKPGEIIFLDKEGFTVACGQDALHITHVHPEASKEMPASSFIAGHRLKVSDHF